LFKQAQNLLPAFRKLLAKRGLTDAGAIEAFLYSGISSLHDPFLMKNMKEVKTALKKPFTRVKRS